MAEWIEVCASFKSTSISLSFALSPEVWKANNLSDKCTNWLYSSTNQNIFARAWLDGYEIEQEQLYTVKIPNPNSKGTNKFYLCKDSNTQKVYLCKGNFNPKKNKNLWLTEPEIKQDFDWAWKWAKPVEE